VVHISSFEGVLEALLVVHISSLAGTAGRCSPAALHTRSQDGVWSSSPSARTPVAALACRHATAVAPISMQQRRSGLPTGLAYPVDVVVVGRAGRYSDAQRGDGSEEQREVLLGRLHRSRVVGIAEDLQEEPWRACRGASVGIKYCWEPQGVPAGGQVWVLSTAESPKRCLKRTSCWALSTTALQEEPPGACRAELAAQSPGNLQ
jgi:hypothetical protein